MIRTLGIALVQYTLCQVQDYLDKEDFGPFGLEYSSDMATLLTRKYCPDSLMTILERLEELSNISEIRMNPELMPNTFSVYSLVSAKVEE